MTKARARDDLFTHIHKALRLGLFDITTRTGSTDWTDPGEVSSLHDRWLRLLDLLRAHTGHEDRHIFRLLDRADASCTEPVGDQHRDLDDLLDDLAERFDAIVADPDPASGLRLYRDMTRFIAAYLPHLHDEETKVMGRIWECCSDDEIATARQGFMAETTPVQMMTTIGYMLPALDAVTRLEMVGGLAATAPPPVIAMVLGVAEKVLPSDAYRTLVDAVAAPVI